MPTWLALGFQDSGSPAMSELYCLHDYILVIMLSIVFLVSYIILYLVSSVYYYKYLSEGTFIETIWSIVPAFLLIILVTPSMKVLYLMEDVKFPHLTVKVVGHQWYWSYVSSLKSNLIFFVKGFNFSYFSYDSNMESVSSEFDQPRLLSCNYDLFLPLSVSSRILVSSSDVIHAFSVPSLGLKVDAFPGRVNQLYANPSRLGSYYGQCSEICGSNHSFMPISVKVLNFSDYSNVMDNFILESASDLLDNSKFSSVLL